VSDACPFAVAGFTFAPTPGVVAGHNARIAWAHTNVGPDTQDLYQIRVNPDNPLQYEWDGEWRDMTVREETLTFGDDTEPFNFQVRETHLGPIINDQPGIFNNHNPMALRWTALEPGTLFEALIRLNLASDWDEFREAISYWDTPSQNIVYADIDGNIGYQVPGHIPVRANEHTGLLPVPGWTSEYEWRGYLPYDLLPRLFNPARGYVATANQAIVPLAYYDWLAEQLGDEFAENPNPVISRRWAYGYRGARINAMIEELAPHSAETFIEIHGDNYDGSAAEVVPFVLDLAVEDEALADLLDWLAQWDYQMHMDSPQAAFYAHFWTRLVSNLYNDRLAEAGRRAGGTNNEWWATYPLLQDPENLWWDDTRTDDSETRDDILLKSLSEALANISLELGEDRNNWRWGDLHTTSFVSDPLGQSGIPLVERMVNRGPVATSGTGSAINATGWSAASPGFEVSALPSERAIYDLSNWDASLSMHTTGQSGHPASTHYDDMIDPWRMIEYRPMVWSREAVEAAAINTLILQPDE
jgi:penicillin G amidase